MFSGKMVVVAAMVILFAIMAGAGLSVVGKAIGNPVRGLITDTSQASQAR